MDDGALPPWTRHQTPAPQAPRSSSFSFSSDPTSSNQAPGMEEEDICRVCRESTPDVPLLHPCKCSGSIKYVHQECLLQWIKTKKVTKCELCKYPFKMSKVYDPQMPSRVPHKLFLQRLVLQLRNNLLTYLRFMLVCFIWLGLVPFVARWIWRFYFRFGDWSAVPSPAPSPPHAIASSSLSVTITLDNVTVYPPTASPTPAENGTAGVAAVLEEGFFGWLKGQDIWTAILRDCFQGQIITICLVAVFIVVFLIREWVMQNAVAVIEEPPAVEGRQGIPAVQLPDEHDGRMQEPEEIVGGDLREETPGMVGDVHDLEDENAEYAFDDDRPPVVTNSEYDWTAMTPPPAPGDFDEPELVEPEPVVPDPQEMGPREQVLVALRQFEADRAVQRNNEFFEDDDLDADDFDGLWDILGMQGPIIGLLHNTVFSALMIALAVGLGVWLPFMFGKTALGALGHPVEVLVQHPVNVARVAVDILLDMGVFCLGGVLLSVHGAVRHFLVIFDRILPLQRYVEYIDQTQFSTTYLTLTQSAGTRILQSLNGTSSRSENMSSSSFLDHPLLTPLKAKIAQYTDFTSLHGTITEKVVAVIAGYFIFTCLGAIYLRVRKLREPLSADGAAGAGDNTERLIRDILRQAGAVLKVVVIITIELVAFPIFCGILIDLACLPLFPGASVTSRIMFAQRFTFTATFLHWFTGTLYMFHFAMFVSMCRDLVRAGTLYFIRDPNDPQFHPIREILERPTMHQLRKIGVSGVIYAMLILACFGVVVKIVEVLADVLPLRISTMEPVFEIPIDLLMSHIALPLTAHFIKPSTVIKGAWKWWFQTTARMLRLSSFLFGTRVADEEGAIPLAEIIRFKRRPRLEQIPVETFVPNGSFLRVPATDTIPLHRRKQMLIPVTEDNFRLDGVEETDEQRNDIDFRVVYVPPNFSTRITILFAWMWLFSVMLGLSMTLVPLLLGRRIFVALFGTMTKMHDIYAYGLGLYALIATILLTEFAAEKTSLLFRQERHNIKRGLWIGGIRLAKWTYLLAVGGIILPLLCGACLDLYVMMPFKRLMSPGSKVEMQVMQDWAFGILHLKIAGRIILYLDGRHAQALRNIFPGHWTNPNIRLATRKFLIPIIKLGCLALFAPLLLAYLSDGIRKILGTEQTDEERVATYLTTYPLSMIMATVIAGVVFAKKAVDRWRDSVRDEIYLVGEVLHNLDEGER